MKRYNKITPEGTKDLLFAECNAQKQIISTLDSIFNDARYHQVVTPGFEFYDVFSSSEMYFPQESMYKLIDDKGRVMVARPDSTIPIARLMGTKLKGCSLPVRLYYGQKIYRRNPGLRGQSNEIMQMGVELIGDSSFKSDVEILSLAAKSLSVCNANDFRIEIGHVGIFKLLMANLSINQEEKIRIHEYIVTKNYTALSERLNQFEYNQTIKILNELPKLFGGKEVFEKAQKLFNGYDYRLIDMLSYLQKIFYALTELGLEEQVIIDFGIVNQADYYSSLVFKGYITSVGEPVLEGGRYDGLLKDFGNDLPATGFGINVDQLASNILRKKEKNFIKNSNNKHIRIALTKGRLEKHAIDLFQSMGFNCENLQEKGRKLFLSIPDHEIDVVFAKAADVITYVEHGVCDLGIVGMDTIMERGGTFYEVLDLGFGKCRFVLAAPKGADVYNGYSTKRIATKYPRVARHFFEEKGMDVEIIRIEGSVELAPILSLADGIVDIVETGVTLKENGLEVIEDIQDISARLIVNEASMKLKKREIDALIEQMEKKVKMNS